MINSKFYNLFYWLFLIVFFLFNCFLKIDISYFSIKAFNFHEYGDLSMSSVRLFYEAKKVVENSESIYFFKPIFNTINPALFMLVAQIFIYLKIEVFFLQILSTLFYLFGIFIYFKWVKIFFNSEKIAKLATILLVISPNIIFFSGQIAENYFNFFFVNLAIFSILLYKKNNNINYIITLFFSLLFIYFNYWWFSISITILSVLLLSNKSSNKIIYSIIIFFFLFHLFWFFYLFYSFTGDDSISYLIPILKNRIINVDQTQFNFFYIIKKIIIYPVYVDHRIRTMNGIGLLEIFILFLYLRLYKFKKEYKYLFFILASLSWYIFFPKHTLIHRFSGIYSFFIIIPIFSYYIISVYHSNFKYKNFFCFLFLSICILINLKKISYYYENILSAHSEFKKIIIDKCATEDLELLKIEDLQEDFVGNDKYQISNLQILNKKINCNLYKD